LLLGRYADRCYASFDHAKQRQRDTGALVLCCVSLFSAYPVIGRSDMDKLQGKGNYQNYDAHLVPVVPADGGNPRELNYFPCEAASLSPPFPGFTYMELVLFESAQVLPCFVVHLSRSRIPRPLLPAPGVPREIDLRYHRMLQGHGMHSPASSQLLQALSLQPQLVKCIEAGEAAAKQRRHDFKSDKLASRATSHIKSAATLTMGAQIGSGTFGTVFRAKWQGFDVAVKQLNKVDGSTSAALQKEAMIMMGVSSPNIVRVFGMVDQPLGIIMVCPALVYLFECRDRVHGRNLCPQAPSTTACAPRTLHCLLCSAYSSCGASHTVSSRCTWPISCIWTSNLPTSCLPCWALKSSPS